MPEAAGTGTDIGKAMSKSVTWAAVLLAAVLAVTGCSKNKSADESDTASTADDASTADTASVGAASAGSSDADAGDPSLNSERRFYGEAPASEWMPAYAGELAKLYDKDPDVWSKAQYGMIYVDSDRIPELIAYDPTNTEQSVIYTYHAIDGISKIKAPSFAQAGDDTDQQVLHIVYREKSNELAFMAYTYNQPDKGPDVASKDVFYRIKNGAWEKIEKGKHDMNAAASDGIESFKYGNDQVSRREYDSYFDPEGAYTWYSGFTYDNALALLDPACLKADDQTLYPSLYNDLIQTSDDKKKTDRYAVININRDDVPELIMVNSQNGKKMLYTCYHGVLCQLLTTNEKSGHSADGFFKQGNALMINENSSGNGYSKYAKIDGGQLILTGYYEWYSGKNGPELDWKNDRLTDSGDDVYTDLEQDITGDFVNYDDIDLLTLPQFMGEDTSDPAEGDTRTYSAGDAATLDEEYSGNGITNGFATNEDNPLLTQYTDKDYQFENRDLILYEDSDITIRIKGYPTYDYTADYTYYEIQVQNHTNREIGLDNIASDGTQMPVEYNGIPTDKQVSTIVPANGSSNIHFEVNKRETDALGIGYLTDISIPFCIYHPLEDDYVEVLRQINLNFSTDLIPGDSVSTSGGSGSANTASAGSKQGNAASTAAATGTSANKPSAASPAATNGSSNASSAASSGSSNASSPASSASTKSTTGTTAKSSSASTGSTGRKSNTAAASQNSGTGAGN